MGIARKFGTIETVIFFRNYADPTRPQGWLLMEPYTGCPTPPGYERDGADSLPAVDRLHKTLHEQEVADRSVEVLHDEMLFGPHHDAVRDRLYAALVSSQTLPYEKDFIREYLKYDIDKRHKFHAKYMEFVTYLHAREMDTPKDRPVDSERVDLDRVNF
jgi:hypothetical protein